MNVVLVEAMEPSSQVMGGSEAYTRNLIHYLAKRNIRTTLIGVSGSNTESTRHHANFVPVSTDPSLGNLAFVWRLVSSKVFARVRPDSVVHVQRPEYALPFILFCPNNPKLITLHGRILDGVRLKQPTPVARLFKVAESLCLKHSTAVIVVDDSTRDFYAREYPWLSSKMRVIPTGIDLDKFRLMEKEAVRTKWGFRYGEKVVMFVGRLEAEKDVGFLIDSFRLVANQVPHARLVLVGDGRDRAKLENMSQALKPETVSFMGAQSPDLMPEILNCADVLTLCSLFEGSPTTVKEALACGVPVVTTHVGDVSKFIRGGIGLVVPKKREVFSRAIIEVLSTADIDRLRLACVTAASEFGFDQIGARTVALYDEALAVTGTVKAMSYEGKWRVKA